MSVKGSHWYHLPQAPQNLAMPPNAKPSSDQILTAHCC